MEVTGLNEWLFTVFEYGERWRRYRRLFHEFFNVATVKRYDEDQRIALSRLLKNLSENPADFRHHVQLATGTLALSITYGIRVDSAENPYFRAAQGTIEILEESQVPGAFPVELLPFREPSLIQRPPRHITELNPTGSSLRSVLAPWGRYPQLWETGLQVLNGQHTTTNGIRCKPTRGTFSLCVDPVSETDRPAEGVAPWSRTV